MGKIKDDISGILNSSQAGLWMKGGLIILTIIIYIWSAFTGKKSQQEIARDTETKDEQTNHDSAVQQNKTDNEQAQADSSRVDDILTGAKKHD